MYFLKELIALPRSLSWIKGPTSKGRGSLLLRGWRKREGMRGRE